ncbi:hypothetical protein [Rhizobium binxianense]
MEKFTRNFSVGKDSPPLPKISSFGLISGQFRSRSAIFLANHNGKMPLRGCCAARPIDRVSR